MGRGVVSGQWVQAGAGSPLRKPDLRKAKTREMGGSGKPREVRGLWSARRRARSRAEPILRY